MCTGKWLPRETLTQCVARVRADGRVPVFVRCQSSLWYSLGIIEPRYLHCYLDAASEVIGFVCLVFPCVIFLGHMFIVYVLLYMFYHLRLVFMLYLQFHVVNLSHDKA